MPKMLLLTFFVGAVIWGFQDIVATKKIKNISDAQLNNLLSERLQEDRIHFDNYISEYQQSLQLISSQKNFLDYILDKKRFPREARMKLYSELPSWLPDASMMRKMVRIHYALLMNGDGRVVEVYQGIAEPVPRPLFRVSQRLIQSSLDQTYLAYLDGVSFLLTSTEAKDARGSTAAIVMIAARLNDDFMISSQGLMAGNRIVGLIERGEKPQVIACNRPDLIPDGTSLDSLMVEYVITGKPFFDWGASEVTVQFSSFMPKSEFEKLNRSILNAERLQRIILSLLFILSFAVIIFAVTRHIRKLTVQIADFSRNTLGMRPPDLPKADELITLREQFQHFTAEIIKSRDMLKRQAEELLREKTVYLDNLLHSSAMSVIATDLDFCIKYFNPVAEKFFGYKAEEVIGKTISDIRIAEKLRPPCFDRIVENVGKDREHICTTMVDTAEGGLYLESRISLILDKENKASGFMVISHDITERKLVEKEIIKLNSELQDHAAIVEGAYRDLESFSYAISHDLKSPLIPIEAFSRILMEDYGDRLDGNARDLLNRIRNSAGKMSQLIDDLLSFSRVSTTEIRRVQINMGALTKNIFDDLKSTRAGRNIRLEIKGLPSSYGDKAMIYQVLSNLLSNAIKFTRTTEAAEIEVGGYPGNNENIYYVRDNGIGFDMKFVEKLFCLFQRVHTSKQFEGTGVGLVIVKKVIEKHGGRVWAQGKPDEGATFYFSLPAKDI